MVNEKIPPNYSRCFLPEEKDIVWIYYKCYPLRLSLQDKSSMKPSAWKNFLPTKNQYVLLLHEN